MVITKEQFKAATGYEDTEDDLERSNCPNAGKLGHSSCGWNHKLNMPVFMVGPEKTEQKLSTEV